MSFKFLVNVADESVLLNDRKMNIHIKPCERCGFEVHIPHDEDQFETFEEFRRAVEELGKPFLCFECREKHEKH